jgi:hypothetical protein
MKKKRKTIEMKLENYLVDQETKNNVMYAMWCAGVKFFGFDSKDSGHILWTKEFIQRAKKRAFAIQFETNEYGYSRDTQQAYKKEIARRLTPEEVIKAVKIEYKNDYALLQFRIIHHELEINKNPLADLFLPEIQRFNWIGIFYGEKEYKAFSYIVNELPKDQKKVLFKILWSMYNKILIKCKGDIWDEWVYKEYFPKEKVTPIAGKFNGNTGNKLFQKVLRISKQYPDQKILEYS